MMKTYNKNFKKTVYGFATVKARNKEEAEELFNSGDFDEFDNKSDYEFEGEIEEQNKVIK